MIPFFWKASRGYRLRPWRSPYLLWRIETYGGLHADRIAPREFWRFAWTQRAAIRRFVFWASRMSESGKGVL